MALTHGSRLFAITLVIATACVASFWGSQRYAQAEETTLAGRILCYINSVAGPPIPRFNVGECPLSQPPPPPAPTPACADGADNDGDGLIDWSPLGGDPGCATPLDTDEANAPVSPPPPPPPPAVENTLPLCSDGIDNDSDSLTDLADSDCSSFNTDDDDDSEPPPPPPPEVVTPPPSGGGGGGGSIGIIAAAAVATALQNISSSTLPVFQGACDQYLTAFIRSGFKNDESQVRRLQSALRDFEGAQVAVNGVYDAATLAAVHAFQVKYASEILVPWGARASTGYVYLTTRKKVNEVYCRNARRFDLSAQELATIAETKARAAAPAAPIQPLIPPFIGITKPPSPPPSLKEETIGKSAVAPQTAAAQAALEAAAGKKSLWRRVLDLFRIR